MDIGVGMCYRADDIKSFKMEDLVGKTLEITEINGEGVSIICGRDVITKIIYVLKVIFNPPSEETKEGLYGKYIIRKADGTPLDKGADYFVLRLDTDKSAREVMYDYANLISIRGLNQKLANDLWNKLDKYKEGE